MQTSIPQLLTHPLQTLKIFFQVLLQDIIDIINSYKSKIRILLFIVSFYYLLHYSNNSQLQNLFNNIDQFIIFASFWIFLGILSSVGLGTGLHTFILYLGPKIAKFVMASSECQKIIIMKPSRFSLAPNFHCDQNGQDLTIQNLFMNIFIEGLLWGFGTAIGELPPYIVSKTASLNGETIDELQQTTGKINIIKEKVFEHIRKHSFITVLLLASIPNPLFDLAGLICGHLQISFWTFFIATAIGKSLIKVNIQIFAIIIAFQDSSIQFIKQILVNNVGQQWGEKLEQFVTNQRKGLLDNNQIQKDEGYLSMIWNVILFLIIGSFVVSIINSKVKNYIIEQEQKKSKQ